MNHLGIAIMNAMREQGWLVAIDDEMVLTVSPTRAHRIVPLALFTEESERRLRIVLLAWIVADGLRWPWPPDHREGIHGEVPISE